MHLQFEFKRASESTPLPVAVKPSGPQTAQRPLIPRQAIWSELHRRALVHGGDDTAWLTDYASRIIGSCKCRDQWRDDLKIMPPDFANYFAWSVTVHNRVNERLKKPLLTVEEALTIWTQPLPEVPNILGVLPGGGGSNSL